MFHMLGRFAFTSSFSRRSSSGLSTGITRFGSCFCKSGPLKVFNISYQSIRYSQSEAATSVARSLIRRTDPGAVLRRCSATPHMGRCLPNHTLSVRGDLCTSSVASRLLAGCASRCVKPLGYSHVAVSLEYQVCGTPDEDLGYHARG